MPHNDRITRVLPAGCHDSIDERKVLALVRDALVCPISLDLMDDPVTTQLGFTYNRAALEQCWQGRQPTDPMTRQPVPPALIPNRALKDLLMALAEPLSRLPSDVTAPPTAVNSPAYRALRRRQTPLHDVLKQSFAVLAESGRRATEVHNRGMKQVYNAVSHAVEKHQRAALIALVVMLARLLDPANAVLIRAFQALAPDAMAKRSAILAPEAATALGSVQPLIVPGCHLAFTGLLVRELSGRQISEAAFLFITLANYATYYRWLRGPLSHPFSMMELMLEGLLVWVSYLVGYAPHDRRSTKPIAMLGCAVGVCLALAYKLPEMSESLPWGRASYCE